MPAPSHTHTIYELNITLGWTTHSQVNTEIVAIQRVITGAGALHLKELIQVCACKARTSQAISLLLLPVVILYLAVALLNFSAVALWFEP